MSLTGIVAGGSISSMFLMKALFFVALTLFSSAGWATSPPGTVEESSVPLSEVSEPSADTRKKALAEEAIRSIVPEDSREVVQVVQVSEDRNPEIFLLHTVEWLQFVEKVRVLGPFKIDDPQTVDNLRREIRRKAPLEPLQRPVIEQSRADEVLRSCHPALEAVAIRPRPPFFNNPTGVHWDRARDFLALEVNATIDFAENRCVRGVVDLRTADLVACITDLPCVVP